MNDHASRLEHEEIPDEIFEAAAIWHVRMRQPGAGSAAGTKSRTEFERWLAADPRNPAAYAEAQRLWLAVRVPEPAARPDTSRAVRRRRKATVVRALAACIAMVAFLGWAWHGGAIDRIRSDRVTGIGERSSLELADRSRLELGSDSAVALDFDAGRRHVRLYRGQAWFEVTPDPARPFVVSTEAGSIRVVGTRFDVHADGDRTTVSVAEGRVELFGGTATTAPAVALVPGQRAQISATGVTTPRPVREAEIGAWRRGQLVFFETPLSDVVAELNRYRSGHIAIADDRIARLRVSGVFRTDDPDAVIAAIHDALPVRIQKVAGYLVLLRERATPK